METSWWPQFLKFSEGENTPVRVPGKFPERKNKSPKSWRFFSKKGDQAFPKKVFRKRLGIKHGGSPQKFKKGVAPGKKNIPRNRAEEFFKNFFPGGPQFPNIYGTPGFVGEIFFRGGKTRGGRGIIFGRASREILFPGYIFSGKKKCFLREGRGFFSPPGEKISFQKKGGGFYITARGFFPCIIMRRGCESFREMFLLGTLCGVCSFTLSYSTR